MSYVYRQHHARYVRYVEAHGLPCQACGGRGCDGYDLVYRPGRSLRLLKVTGTGGVITKAQEAYMADGWPVTIVRSVDDVWEL